MSDLRLTFCQQAPYVIWDSDISTYRGAWCHQRNLQRTKLDDFIRRATRERVSRWHAVHGEHPRKTKPMWQSILSFFTYSETTELISAYPIDGGVLFHFWKRHHNRFGILIHVIGVEDNRSLIGLAVLTTVIIDRHGSRSRHIPRVILSVFNSVDLPDKCRPSIYLLYCWISLLSLLFLLYTSIMAEILHKYEQNRHSPKRRRQCDHQHHPRYRQAIETQ
jgi:hypothetical protein